MAKWVGDKITLVGLVVVRAIGGLGRFPEAGGMDSGAALGGLGHLPEAGGTEGVGALSSGGAVYGCPGFPVGQS